MAPFVVLGRSVAPERGHTLIPRTMICINCGKESKNRRVCPFCFTENPTETPSRGSASRDAAVEAWRDASGVFGGLIAPVRQLFLRQTPVTRYSILGILAVLVLWALLPSSGDEVQIERGVAQSEIIATPMQREEALQLIKRTRETALVETQNDEVFVSYPAATFPLKDAGRLALIQQFARADEIVEGRKRRIFFHNPNGQLFGQADPVRGVVLTR